MKLLKDSFYSVFAVGFRSLTTFVIHKIFAVSFGPNGITLLSHFQNLSNIIISIPNDGINKGLIAYFTDQQSGEDERKNIFLAGVVLNTVFFVLGLTGVFFFYEHFSTLFVNEGNGLLWFTLVFTAIFFQIFNQYLLSVLVARKFMKAFLGISVAGNIVAIALVSWGAFNLSVSQALLMVALGQAAGFIFSMVLLVYKSYLPFKFSTAFRGFGSLRKLGDFILMALSILICGKLVSFLVREYVILQFDLYQTGLWQSVVKVSSGYITIFSSLATMVYYPRVSERLKDYSVLGDFIRKIFALVVPGMIIMLGIIYFFRETVLYVLFDKDFMPAAYLMDYQMIGDGFQMGGHLLGLVLMAQARTKLFVGLQFFSSALYLVLAYFAADTWGMEGIPMAHMVRYSVYFLLMVFFCRKILIAR